MIQELDEVVLRCALPELVLAARDIGSVVLVHDEIARGELIVVDYKSTAKAAPATQCPHCSFAAERLAYAANAN